MSIEVVLPAPPSTNALFANVSNRGRVKTAKYKAWITQAGIVLNVARMPKNTTPVSLTFRIGSCNQSRDLDNVAKPLCDLLVAHGIIPDDNLRHVHEVHILKAFFEVPEGMIGIRIDQA